MLTRFKGLRFLAAPERVMLCTKLSRLGLSFVINIAIARHLGAADFGILGVGVSLAAIAGILVTQGLETPLRLHLIRSPSEANELISAISLYRMAMAIIVFFVFYVFADRVASVAYKSTLICLATVFCLPLQTVDLLLQARNRLLSSAFLFFISVLSGVLLRAFFLIWNEGVIYFSIAFFVEALLLSFLLIGAGTFFFNDWRPISLPNLKRLFFIIKENTAIIFSSLIIIFYMRIDILLAAHFLGFSSAGVFSVAQRIVEVFYIVPPILTTAALSFLHNRFLADEKESEILKLGFYKRHLRFSLVASAVLIIAGPVFEYFIFRGRYPQLAIVIIILSLAIPFAFLGSARATLLIMESKQKYVFYSSLIGIMSAFILGPLLIINLGIIGSCLNYLFSQFASCILSALFFPALKKHFLLKLKAARTLFAFYKKGLCA